MATSKFDELVNLITRQVVRRLQGRDRIETGSDRETSGRPEGDLSYDPVNTGDELDVSSDLDPEMRRNFTEPSAEEEYQSEDDIEAVTNYKRLGAKETEGDDYEEEEEEEEEEEDDWRNTKSKKLRDGFEMMRGKRQ